MKKALTLILATLSILACSSPAGIDKESFASPAKDHYLQTLKPSLKPIFPVFSSFMAIREIINGLKSEKESLP